MTERVDDGYNGYMSDTLPAPPLPKRRTRLTRRRRAARFLFRTAPGRVVIVLFLLLTSGWAYWYNEHRHIGWEQTFSPVYWFHRWRGDDLYLPESAFLLHGNRALPEVALTFDDGPHRASRGEILDTLKANHVPATFFDVGINMDAAPELLQRTLAEGHEVANHSENHNRLDKLNPHLRHREINDADIAFYRITGKHLTLLRPPGMSYNDTVLADCHALGYVIVGDTTSSRDFDPQVSPDFIAERTLRRAENGSIILLHDYPATAAALPKIIAVLRKEGFQFVTISQMLAHLPEREREKVQAFQQTSDSTVGATSSAGATPQ